MIYLDNSATTKPSQAVKQAVMDACETAFENPSSAYEQAHLVEQRVEKVRQTIQNSLKSPGAVLFTSGGTEANNLAILGHLATLRDKGRVLYSAIEHPSVRDACKVAADWGFTPEALAVDGEGQVDLDKIKQTLSDDVVMCCVMQVNNELGSVQPLDEIARLLKAAAPKAWFHVDGVQGYLRHAVKPAATGIDSYALSGHKIHALKGIGALWLRPGLTVSPRAFGGGQQSGIRPGTENTPGIFSLEAAILSYPDDNDMRANKLALYERLRAGIPNLAVNGPAPDSPAAADHILSLSFKPVRAETLVHLASSRGVLVGTGSACSAKKKSMSPVLEAIGADFDTALSTLRLSLNPSMTRQELMEAADVLIAAYNELKAFERR